jgi:high-affinity K+ transport system ATPase subunit B
MADTKLSSFEIVLLIVGIGTAVWGFQLINRVYSSDGNISWLMVIAIFNWLMLLILFISLSLAVDVSKKQYEGVKKIIEILEKRKGKKQ